MDIVATLGVENWHRLNKLLEQALDLEVCDRAAWLERQRQLEPALQDVLRSLLEQAEHETSWLAEPKRSALPEEKPGDQIGPYRLVRGLARGGMGVVWVAERADGSFERLVALKLPRAEWTAPGLARRMARERNILASLTHPHIAQLYDAGWTDDGRPFIALELVDGTPIDAYCAERQLSVRERVALFVDVAQAVAFAHARLVVHRDLKPGNVMVTRDGSVKLLDFGIAKLLVGEVAVGATAVTRVGDRALTTAYASPEQMLGRPVSTACDVYSLGVMLYELVSGTSPYGPASAGSSAALEETILNIEPLAPSRAGDGSRHHVRDDLDTIVLKALKKKPEERYESAAALADDLERYLAQQPIRARPDSRWYRGRMFWIRNRFPLGIAGAVCAAILVGALVSVWQAQTAREEVRRASAIKDFVLSLIRQADPMASAATREADVALLSAAEERVAKEMAGQPEVTIELRLAIADAYANRGLMDKARATLHLAIDEGRRSLHNDDLSLARARIKMAQNFVLGGQDVIGQLDVGIATARSGGDRGHRLLAEGLLNRANLNTWAGESSKVGQDLQEAYDLARRSLGIGDPLSLQIAWVMAWPSEIRVDKRAVIEQAYLAGRANPQVGEAHPALLRVQVLYAYYIAKDLGRTDEATSMIRSAIDTARRHHGDGRPTEEVFATAQLAFFGARQLQAAFEAAREAHRLAAARHAANEPIVGLRAMNVLASLLSMRRVDGAAVLISPHNSSLDDSRLRAKAALLPQALRAQVLLMQGKPGEAESLLEDAARKLKEPHHSWALGIPWAWASRENGRPERSLEILAGVDADRLVWDDDRPRLFNQLAASHLALADPQRAMSFADKAIASGPQPPPFTPDDAEAYLLRGRALLGLGRPSEAADALAISHAFWRDFGPTTAWAAETTYWYGQALREAGDVERGTELVRGALPVLKQSPMPSHRAVAERVAM